MSLPFYDVCNLVVLKLVSAKRRKKKKLRYKYFRVVSSPSKMYQSKCFNIKWGSVVFLYAKKKKSEPHDNRIANITKEPNSDQMTRDRQRGKTTQEEETDQPQICTVSEGPTPDSQKLVTERPAYETRERSQD